MCSARLAHKWPQGIANTVAVVYGQLRVNYSESRAQIVRSIVVTNPVAKRTCEIFGCRIVLQQLRYQPFAGKDIR